MVDDTADETPKPADPFDPANLRLKQDFGAEVGVKKLLTRVPVRKPNGQDFIRVHPGEDYRVDAGLIELKDEREIYLVIPELHVELSGEIRPARLFTTLNRQGILTLWPCWLPSSDGRTNAWHQTALEAAEMAMEQWTRIRANMNLGGYETFVAHADLPEPEFPTDTFSKLLEIAFRDRRIDDVDHPILKRLRGSV